MFRPLIWSHLTKGLLVLAVVIALAAVVLRYARIGALHGDTTTLYMVTNKASRVIKGTEVWLGGQKVGLVREVRFRSPSADTTERLLIVMDVLSQYMPHIRKDSDIQIRPGVSLIGAPVVYITVGSSSASPVENHDTLRARAQVEGRGSIAGTISSLGDSVVTVANAVKAIAQQLDSTNGRITQLRQRSEGQIAVARRALGKYAGSFAQSKGTLPLILSDTALQDAVYRVTAQADSLEAVMSGTTNSLGRFRRDSTLVLHAEQTLARVDTLRQHVVGGASRLSATPTAPGTPSNAALVQQLDRVHVQLDSLVNDAKHHPLKYLSL